MSRVCASNGWKAPIRSRDVPPAASLFVDDNQGNRIGRIRKLGRGGFLLQTSRRFAAKEKLTMIIVAEEDGIRRQVSAVHRYITAEGDAGFAFHNLDAEAAVEMGVLIGKYFHEFGAAN